MSRLINHKQSFRGAEETLWIECSPETQNRTGWLSFCDLMIQFLPCLWSDPGYVMLSRRGGCTAPHWEWIQMKFPFPSQQECSAQKDHELFACFSDLVLAPAAARQPGLLGSLKQQVLTDWRPFPGLRVSVQALCCSMTTWTASRLQRTGANPDRNFVN